MNEEDKQNTLNEEEINKVDEENLDDDAICPKCHHVVVDKAEFCECGFYYKHYKRVKFLLLSIILIILIALIMALFNYFNLFTFEYKTVSREIAPIALFTVFKL